MDWPLPEKSDKKKTSGAASKKTNKRGRADSRDVSNSQFLATATKNQHISKIGERPSSAGADELDSSFVGSEVSVPNAPESDGDTAMADGEAAPTSTVDGARQNGHFTSEDKQNEIKKLRVSGSMTQNPTEIHRVRNLGKILLGKYEVEPWYFSSYPESFQDAEIVYIDEFCLSYFDEKLPFQRHRAKCSLVHPPGNEIYRDDNVSFFEVDGRRQRTWCRNLCLLSKLFLDHKTLYYDVDPFLFYCMCVRDEYGFHLVGYFSKEKESAEGFNVACILTLPQYQRSGYGRLLIAFSYELSKREGKLGSPEKPLSDLGLLSYRKYWKETLVELLINASHDAISENELALKSGMTEKDVHETLVVLNLLRYNVSQNFSEFSPFGAHMLIFHQKGNWIVVLTDDIIEQHEKRLQREKLYGSRRIDSSRLQWKPPVFSAFSRTWNW